MHSIDLEYLIGAYIVVADREINDLECQKLDELYHVSDEVSLKCALIYSDSEKKPDYRNLISELQWTITDTPSQIRCIENLCKIALADGYLGKEKLNILKEVATALDISCELLDNIISNEKDKSSFPSGNEPLTWQQSLTASFESLFYEWMKLDGENEDEDETELLSGIGFIRKIKEITKSAYEELAISKDAVSDTVLKVKTVQKRIEDYTYTLESSKRESDKDMAAIIDNVKSLNNAIKQTINDSLLACESALEKKRRNIEYFTIAFMGRTKAGKSTLHKVVTHQKSDDIGVGKLRTTRYNRSWYWQNLRIVDTPGIGAPGGDKDTEIAASIIDEADMICYVVLNDSIQETEFDFLETVKERNKPLFILLNCKIGLDKGPKLKKFLRNPDEWRTTEGPQSINGHLERIMDKLDGKYNMEAIKVIPLQLLAALMYYENNIEDSADAQKLFQGSNIKEFIREIKSTVFNSGSLKKCMSILDGTAYHLYKTHSLLTSYNSNLSEKRDNLSKRFKELEGFIKIEQNKLKKDVEDIFEATRKSLKIRASEFAADEYDNNKAGDKWESDPVVKTQYERMNDSIKSRINDFAEKIKERLEELVADIHFNERFDIGSDIEGQDVTSWKFGAQIISTGITATLGILAATNIWNPGGWILGGIALVLGWFSSFFTSKEKKIQKARDKMRSQLEASIDKNINEIKKRAIENIDIEIPKILRQIDNSVGRFVRELTSLIKEINDAAIPAIRMENRLNSIEAGKILEFINPGLRLFDDKIEDIEKILQVKRNWQNQEFKIATTIGAANSELESLASNVTQMKILIYDRF